MSGFEKNEATIRAFREFNMAAVWRLVIVCYIIHCFIF